MAKGRGPRGEGSFSVVCARVVLDANLFRGAPVEEIEALRDRGFEVSVSLEGLREVWAKSLRQASYNLLAARVAQLAPLLSSSDPVAFTGHALLTTFGTGTAAVRDESIRFRQGVTDGWRRMVATGLSEEDWRSIGSELQTELSQEERIWAEHIRMAKEIDSKVSDVEKQVGFQFYPRTRAAHLMRHGLAQGAGVVCSPPLERRAELHLRYAVDKLLNARQREPSMNDWNDARHLQHVAWPAFLATCDNGLIEAADRPGSSQSAWVRMPVELAQDRVLRSEPWSKGAAEHGFRRQAIKDLQKRQDAFRGQWRRGRTSADERNDPT